MKFMKYLLLPLSLSVATSVFAGSWSEPVYVTGLTEYADSVTGDEGVYVTFNTSVNTEACQTTGSKVAYGVVSDLGKELVLNSYKKGSYLKVYLDKCRYDGLAVMGGVQTSAPETNHDSDPE